MQGMEVAQATLGNPKGTDLRERLLQGQQLALQDPARVQLCEVWQVGGMHQAILCSMPHKQTL